MDHSHLMEIVQASQHLLNVNFDQILRQRIFLDETCQTASLNVLQHYIQTIVLILKDVDVFNNVLVTQLPQQIDLRLH